MIPHQLEDSDASSTSPMSSPVDMAARPNRRRCERRHQRLSVKLFVRTGDAVSYMGLTENLSEGGVFVATRAPWEIGTSVDLIIGLPQQKIVHAKGRVRWRRSTPDDSVVAPGVGIRLERLSLEDADRIRELVNA
jgi:uncharacterized protein (TIGR02266 family)